MDEAELQAQLAQHHPLSYGWALQCCRRDPELAADVLQVVYLKILQGRARYDGRAAFKTWLFAVIRTTAADERRRLWLRRLRLADYQQQRTPEADPPPPGAALDRTALLAAFQRVLARLPRRQQEVLHLVFYQDLTVQEAATVMGVGVGSARTHYERAKASLRLALESSETHALLRLNPES
jgi:RNA polymerase sigma factor (sigma-70 family)